MTLNFFKVEYIIHRPNDIRILWAFCRFAEQGATLSQGGPRDAAVNFGTHMKFTAASRYTTTARPFALATGPRTRTFQAVPYGT